MYVELNNDLRTDTVTTLAATCYSGNNDTVGNHLLPILADALEDAGCTDSALLADLRKNATTGRVCIALRFYA